MKMSGSLGCSAVVPHKFFRISVRFGKHLSNFRVAFHGFLRVGIDKVIGTSLPLRDAAENMQLLGEPSVLGLVIEEIDETGFCIK